MFTVTFATTGTSGNYETILGTITMVLIDSKLNGDMLSFQLPRGAQRRHNSRATTAPVSFSPSHELSISISIKNGTSTAQQRMASSSQMDSASRRILVVCLDAWGVNNSHMSTLIRLYNLLDSKSEPGQIIYYMVHPNACSSIPYLCWNSPHPQLNPFTKPTHLLTICTAKSNAHLSSGSL